MKYEIGMGKLPLLVVIAAFLGIGGYFAYGAMLPDLEPMVLAGNTLLEGRGLRILLWIAAAWMGGTGVFLLLRSILTLGKEQYVLLDDNRIVTVGMGLTGAERSLTYGEVASFDEYSVRGIPTISIAGRNGSKLILPASLFREKEGFNRFRGELYAKLERHNPNFALSTKG